MVHTFKLSEFKKLLDMDSIHCLFLYYAKHASERVETLGNGMESEMFKQALQNIVSRDI